MSEQICKKIPKHQMGSVISPKGIKTPRIRFKEAPATSATYPKKRARLIPKNQTGNKIIDTAVQKYNTPEEKEKREMDAANRRSLKISGRVDDSPIQIDDVLTLGGATALKLGAKPIAKIMRTRGLGKELLKNIHNTTLKAEAETGPTIFKNAWHASDEALPTFRTSNPEGYFAKHGGTDKAIFFTERAPEAQSFLSKRPHQATYDVQMNKPKVLDYRTPTKGGTSKWAEGINQAEKEGYDGVVVKGIRDNQMDNSTIYASLDPQKIYNYTPKNKLNQSSGMLPEEASLQMGRVMSTSSGVKMDAQRDVSPVIRDFFQRVKSPEGQRRLANLGRSGDNFKNIKYRLTSDVRNPGKVHYEDGNPVLTLNRNVLKEDISNIARHELEHIVQHKRQSPIDYELADLELRQYHPNLKESVISKNPVLNYSAFYREAARKPISNKRYFEVGSEGREKSAMLAELQQHLLDTKQISHAYASDEITPQLMESVYNTNKEKIGGFPLRILSIIEPTQKNFGILSSGLNKMLTATGVTAGASAISKEKKGGLITKHQTGNRIIDMGVAKYNTPEERSKRAFVAANTRAAKISGRVDDSPVQIDDILTMGTATALKLAAKPIAKSIGAAFLKKKVLPKASVKAPVIVNSAEVPIKKVTSIDSSVLGNDIPAGMEITDSKMDYILKNMKRETDGAHIKGTLKEGDNIYLVKEPYEHTFDLPRITSELNKTHKEIIPVRQSVRAQTPEGYQNIQLQDAASGNYLHRIPEQDLEGLTQAQIDNAKNAIRGASDKGVYFDLIGEKNGNVFYDPGKGFQFIDMSTSNRFFKGEDAIEAFRKQLKHGITKSTDYPADHWLKGKNLLLGLSALTLLGKNKGEN